MTKREKKEADDDLAHAVIEKSFHKGLLFFSPVGAWGQSVKASETGGPRGYDAGKKINGRKRQMRQVLAAGVADFLSPVMASIHFFKRLLFAQGIYPTPAVRPPILPFDDTHARVAQELIGRACAIEAEAEGARILGTKNFMPPLRRSDFCRFNF